MNQEVLKTQARGNCQCCGRLQAVLAGVWTMSKHGYEVKKDGSYAYFSGVCGGHSFMPMQLERKVTDSLVISARAEAARLYIRVDALSTGLAHPEMARSGKRVPDPTRAGRMVDEEVLFALAPAHHQEAARESLIWALTQRARGALDWAHQMERLVNEMYGKPLHAVLVASALSRIQEGDKRRNPRARDKVLIARSQEGATVYWRTEDGFKGKMSSRAWRLLPTAE